MALERKEFDTAWRERGIGLGYPGYLESAARLVDKVRNQGLGLKLLVGKQTITFLLW
jgi:hypothetical protein